MGLLIDKASAVNSSALAEHVSVRILSLELHPTFIKIALLGNQTVANAAVRQHDTYGNSISRRQRELLRLDGRNQLPIVLTNCEEIDRNSALQKFCCFLELIGIVVESRDCRVCPQPAMGPDVAILTGIVVGSGFRHHVTALACACDWFGVERRERLLGPGGLLP